MGRQPADNLGRHLVYECSVAPIVSIMILQG